MPLAQAVGTPYAIKNGLFVDDGVYNGVTVKEYVGKSYGWLRSPGASSGCAANVNNNGNVNAYGNNVNNNNGGARVAFFQGL